MSETSSINNLLELSYTERKAARRRKIIIFSSVVVLCLVITAVCLLAKRIYVPGNDNHPATLYGEPLYLTPYIKSGKIADARQLSLVQGLPDAPPITSYSGFFTVNETYDSNIFFWFVPSTDGNKSAPLLLWLQGGPGLTSLFGFFVENGPYVVYSNMTAGLRQHAWTDNYQVLFVDNPVGAGFSFTNHSSGYATDEDDMAEGMYEFLRQFFQVFYDYKNNEFYIAGESYAGKYVPSLSYKIHMEGNASEINFKGMIIGNGLCDPETMMDYGDYVYQLGLVDRKQAEVMRNISKSIVEDIQNKNFTQALMGFSSLIVSFNVLPYPSYFKNVTQYDFFYNYLITKEPPDFEYYRTYLDNPKVRNALHVGNLTFQDGKVAQKNMLMDIMQSVKPKIETIMDNNYRVLFYSGQLDLIIPYPLTINFLNSVKWKYSKEYQEADRLIWKLKDSDTIAGYVHTVENFYEVLIRDTGHIVPYDNPEVGLELITRFLNRQSYA